MVIGAVCRESLDLQSLANKKRKCGYNSKGRFEIGQGPSYNYPSLIDETNYYLYYKKENSVTMILKKLLRYRSEYF